MHAIHLLLVSGNTPSLIKGRENIFLGGKDRSKNKFYLFYLVTLTSKIVDEMQIKFGIISTKKICKYHNITNNREFKLSYILYC